MTQEEIEKYALLLANNAKKLDYGRDVESGRGWWGDRNAIAYNAANKMAKKLLSHLPQWISVEDSLPECLNKVLMLNANGTIKVGLHNGEYWTAEDGCSFWATYWMPLPEPPVDLYQSANPD